MNSGVDGNDDYNDNVDDNGCDDDNNFDNNNDDNNNVCADNNDGRRDLVISYYLSRGINKHCLILLVQLKNIAVQLLLEKHKLTNYFCRIKVPYTIYVERKVSS